MTLELETFLPYRLNRLADVVSRDFAKIYRDRHGLTRPEWRLLHGRHRVSLSSCATHLLRWRNH